MTKEVFNLGTAPNSGNGDSVRVAFQKVASNFDELYQYSNTTNNTLAVVDGRIVLVNSNVALLRSDFVAQTASTAAALSLVNSNTSTLALLVESNQNASTAYANAVSAAVQSNVAALTATVASQATTTTSSLNDLLARISASNSVVSALSSNATSLGNRVEILEATTLALGTLTNNVTLLEGHAVTTDSAISNLLYRAGLTDNAVIDLNNDILSLTSNVAQDVNALNNQANSTIASVATLGNTVAQHTASIAATNLRIDNAVSAHDTLDARANSITNAVVAVDNRVDGTVASISNVLGLVGTAQASANAAMAQAVVAQDQVAALTTSVATQQSLNDATHVLVNSNVALLSANTASGFLTANAVMDSINATITNMAANSLSDTTIINARLNATETHANATNNPHNVTPAQIGAIPTALIGVASGIAELDAFGRLKTSQRAAYGYDDFITGKGQIDFIPTTTSLKIGNATLPWGDVFVQRVNADTVTTGDIISASLTATANAVSISKPLTLTGITNTVLTVNGSPFITKPDANSIQIIAANVAVLSSGADITGNLDLTQGDIAVAAQDDVILLSNLRAGWSNRHEIRFRDNGAISASTYTLVPTATGINFTATDFTITSTSFVVNTAKPLVLSGVEFSYDGNAVFHAGNFTPAQKVDVTAFTDAAVFAKVLTQDGTGSNLDADKLDGEHGIYYRAFENQTGRPTTLAGYGITDALLANAALNATTFNGETPTYYRTFSNLLSRPTTLVGYGITDAQPLSPKLTSLAGMSSNGILILTDNTVSSRDIGTANSTDVIDRQAGDIRYVQSSTANSPNGYVQLNNAGLIPASILTENAVTSVVGQTGDVTAAEIKTALALTPADIAGLTAILDDKVSKSESTWAPVSAIGTGSSQSITLPQSDLTPANVMVAISGIVQDPSEYSISTNQLTITAPTGVDISIRRFGLGAALGRTASIQFVIDGNGSLLTTGVKGDLTIPFSCTIVGWSMLGDTTGSIVVELWKSSFENSPPTVADKITGSNPPVLSSQNKSKSTTMATWSPTVIADDVVRINVASVSDLTRVTLSLTVVI